MYVSNIDSQMAWSQASIGNSHWEKEQDVAEERSHTEVGQHFSETNILVLAPGDDHSTVQCECRNEVKKWLQVDQDHQ